MAKVNLRIKRDIDKGLKAYVARIAAAKVTEVKVGILSEAASEQKNQAAGRGQQESKTLFEVASANEFGMGVPERSFVRGYVDGNQKDLEKVISTLGRQVASGQRTKQQALDTLGSRAAAGMQKRISEGIDPPNAEMTVRLKGSSKPLIDTGQLRSAISYEVVLDGRSGGNAGTSIKIAKANEANRKDRAKKKAKLTRARVRRVKAQAKKLTKEARRTAKRLAREARRAASRTSKQINRSAKQAERKFKQTVNQTRRYANKVSRQWQRTASKAAKTVSKKAGKAAKAVRKTLKTKSRRRKRK